MKIVEGWPRRSGLTMASSLHWSIFFNVTVILQLDSTYKYVHANKDRPLVCSGANLVHCSCLCNNSVQHYHLIWCPTHYKDRWHVYCACVCESFSDFGGVGGWWVLSMVELHFFAWIKEYFQKWGGGGHLCMVDDQNGQIIVMLGTFSWQG
jgi:hypothetical protein